MNPKLETSMQSAMAKALRARDAAVPKADAVNATKGFRANKNSMENTGKRKHDEKAC